MNDLNNKVVHVVLPTKYKKSIMDLRNEYDELKKELDELPFEPEGWCSERLNALREQTQAPSGFAWKRDYMSGKLFLEPEDLPNYLSPSSETYWCS